MTGFGALPGQRSSGAEDDDTAALLRDVLRRRADEVTPVSDALERILSAAHARPAVPGPNHQVFGPSGADPYGADPYGADPYGADPYGADPYGRPATASLHEPSGLLPVGPPAPRPREVRWLPALAAAAVVMILSTGLALLRPGMISASGLGFGGGSAPVAAPAPHPPAADPLPVYYVQRQNDRWALVREFRPTTLTEPAERLETAVRLAIAGQSSDHDHTSVWRELGLPTDSLAQVSVTVDADGLVIGLPATLVVLPPGSADPGAAARLAVQQIVWTATATAADNVPVRLRGPSDEATLFGTLPLEHPFNRDPADPRAPVWVSSLVDGQRLAVGRAVVRGDAVVTATDEVTWRLLPDGGTGELAHGVAELRRADGGVPRDGDRAVWEVTLQIPSAGRYELQVSQTWRDGGVAWVDTKTLVAS